MTKTSILCKKKVWLTAVLAAGLFTTALGATTVGALAQKSKRFSQAHDIPHADQNAIQHAYASMRLTQYLSAPIANALGYGFEMFDNNLRESYKDKWNNSIGRQVALQAEEHDMEDEALLLHAYQTGQLIMDRDSDPRIVVETRFENPQPEFMPPGIAQTTNNESIEP